MGTTIRPEISQKNEFYIEKHRYYELKHFCMQYTIWKKARAALDGLSSRPDDLNLFKTNSAGSPTERCAIARAYYTERINMLEHAAYLSAEDLARYILKAVTEGLSYETLKANYDIPCCKDVYYRLYRKFFYVLNLERK